jgi:hypothetical protein
MGVLSSEKAQKGLRVRSKDKTRIVEDALRSVMDTPDGRTVFRWLLSSNVTGLTSNAYFSDSNRTAWAEGRRSVGVEVLTVLEHVAPGSYARLVTEGAAESKEDKIHAEHAEAEASEEDNE